MAVLLALPLGAACDNSSVDAAAGAGGLGGKDGGGGTGGVAADSGVGGAAGAAGDAGLPPGKGVGETCSASDPCRKGLACNNGICEPGHSSAQGEPCLISAECQTGLTCLAGTCASAGAGQSGDACVSDADCQSGLRCGIVGFALQCIPEGNGDVGTDCTTSADCFGGLACLGAKCAKPPPGAPTFGLSTWKGVTCDAPSTGTVRAYFEVPGATSPKGQEGDFFRLPFPTDARISGGKIDLTGFPTPGAELLGFDPVKVYLDAISASQSAWGTYSTAYFRFSGGVDFESLKTVVNGKFPVQWVDVTAGTPEYGSSAGLYFWYSSNRSHYICDNYLAVRRPEGQPLVVGHKYAIFVYTSAVDANKQPIQRSEHFVAMLSDTAPTDAKLAAAHATFKPFRDFLKDKAIGTDTVLNATVITAGNVRAPMQALGTTLAAQPVPASKSWVKCGAGVVSPCPQATGERACGDGSATAYDEYHALVTLPVFQKGTPPYTDAGGDVATGQPERQEDVCLALTVPKGASMPAAGWPLVVYAHGTGGSFRSHVRAEVAGALAKATTPSGSVGFAVLGIDQVEHGPRRGTSTASPNDLFFNFKNPSAAQGNPIQGAVDQIMLGRFAAQLKLTATESGGDAIQIDPAGLVFYGHSQGSTHGSLALPYTELYKAAVLSGNGASLIHALTSKTKPVNVKAALPLVLADIDPFDGSLPGGDMHPVLSLLQQWIDAADPVNYARAIAKVPETGHSPKHVFQTYGLGDSYSPGITMATFAIAAGLDLGAADASVTKPEDISNLTEKPLPLAGNVKVGAVNVTLVVREYGPPSGKDGHFVALDVPTATTDLARFLGMAAQGAVPQVGP